MSYKNKYVITYNGEVYNFQTERKLLEAEGYRFNSNSDTEVILALYDKYGVRCLEHLRGMFAFAIYDRVKNIVFLARDRLGKKPLKYFLSSEVFIFASELKAILTQNEVKKEFLLIVLLQVVLIFLMLLIIMQHQDRSKKKTLRVYYFL